MQITLSCRRCRHRGRGAFGHDRGENLVGQLGLFHQRQTGGIFALADQVAGELEPGAFFLDNAILDADFQEAAFLVDAVVVENLELGFGEGGRTKDTLRTI